MKNPRPLVALHEHLDGCVRIATMLDIAINERITLPSQTREGLAQALRCGEIRQNLGDYLSAFPITTSVMQSQSALTRIAREHVEDAARDGVKWLEPRFMPELHTARGLSLDFVFGAVRDGLYYAGKQHGVGWGMIVCSMRHVHPDVTGRMIDLAIRYKNHGIVAVDLAGDDNLPAYEHAKHYLRAKENGLEVVIHAGESGPAIRVVEAVEKFGATRIGHGNKALIEPELVEYLFRHRVGVEACPTSNVQTKGVESYETHPAQNCLNAGMLVSINTDNRTLADTTAVRELELVRQHWNLNLTQVQRLIWNGIYMSFAPKAVKQQLSADLFADLEALSQP